MISGLTPAHMTFQYQFRGRPVMACRSLANLLGRRERKSRLFTTEHSHGASLSDSFRGRGAGGGEGQRAAAATEPGQSSYPTEKWVSEDTFLVPGFQRRLLVWTGGQLPAAAGTESTGHRSGGASTPRGNSPPPSRPGVHPPPNPSDSTAHWKRRQREALAG